MLKLVLPAMLMLVAGPAIAAPIVAECRVGVLFSGLPGVVIGDNARIAIRYDNAFATSGVAELTPGAGLLDAMIEIGRQMIDDSDDVDFSNFPYLQLLDGEIDYFSLVNDVYEIELFASTSFVTITQPGDGGSLFLVGTAERVPEPAGVALLGLAAVILASVRRRAPGTALQDAAEICAAAR